jgi:2'-5' RNA ligase
LKGEQVRFAQKLRWVASEKWHITLHFLGNVPNEKTSVLVKELEGCLEEQAPFFLRLGGISGFPRRERANVLFAEVEQGREELGRLVETLEAVLIPLGLGGSAKPFSAHLTLARAKRGKLCIPKTPFLSPACLIRSVHLVQSILFPTQKSYKTLLKMELRGGSGLNC